MRIEMSQGSGDPVLLRSAAARAHCLDTGRAVEQSGQLIATDYADTVGRSMIEICNGGQMAADLGDAYDKVAADMARQPILSREVLDLIAGAVNAQYPEAEVAVG